MKSLPVVRLGSASVTRLILGGKALRCARWSKVMAAEALKAQMCCGGAA